jgi:AcrR family transcriptional regulator
MPPEIDVSERLTAIAEATLQVAREEGPRAATIRAVAARLGGSTTLITKYVPTRAALLSNAFRHMTAHWDGELAVALEGRTGMDRLRALSNWSLDTEGYDDAFRRLWLEKLAGPGRGPTGLDDELEEARDEHASIVEAVDGAFEDDDTGWLVDTLFLAFRGFFISSIEDPENWPAERASAAINRLLDAVEAADVSKAAARSV